MFGYVTIAKPEIRFKDYDTYRSYYCGLCRQLKGRYGAAGRMTLSYDMTFLILLLTGLYDTETETELRCCAAHPLKKHREQKNEFTSYAADMNLLLFYYKCLDDWQDERKLRGRIFASILSPKVRGIRERYPKKAERIRTLLGELSQMERRAGECPSGLSGSAAPSEGTCCDGMSGRSAGVLDECAGAFGEILAEIFAYRQDVWEDSLRQMGFYLGKFIYLMDAYDDVEEDLKKGNFNPLVPLCGDPDFDARCGAILKLMISECAERFERLPVTDHAEILRNIIYAGVWSKYEAVLQRKERKKEDV